MSAETNIGSIVGFLRMDADQFHREITKAIAEIEALEAQRANVKVDVDTTGAARGLDRVASSSRSAATSMDSAARSSRSLTDAAEKLRIAQWKLGEAQSKTDGESARTLAAKRAVTLAQRAQQDAVFDTYRANLDLADSNDKVDTSNRHVERSSRDAGRGMGALVTAIVALGPAIVPLAAGAVGLGVAFGGMGVAGLAAFQGIKHEIAQGTIVGRTYTNATAALTRSLEGVGTVAAGNLLGPYQRIVRELIDETPNLTTDVSDLTNMLGHAGISLTGGLLAAWRALVPLMRDGGAYVTDLSARFDTAMSGPGMVAFVDYVRSVFPDVVATIEEIVTAAGHLVAGFAPLGMGVLSELRLLAELINAIPVEVLQVLAPLATGVFLGFKTWSGLSGVVSKFGTMLEGVGVSAERAAVGMRALNIASGLIGAGLAILSVIFTAVAGANRENEQAANDYADALERTNGVIDESIRKMTAKRLADSGALDAARELGISLPTVTDAALGEADAMATVTAAIEANSHTKRSSTTANGIVVSNHSAAADAADKLKAAILGENSALDAGTQKHKDIAAASSTTKAALSNEAIAAAGLADRYGTSAATYQAVVTSQKQHADAAAKATLKMQLENDAAGLLKQSLDALSGKALSAAQAQNGFDRSIVTLTQSTRNAKGQIDKAKTSLSGMGDAAVTNRGNLLNLATQANNVATATANQTGSTEKGRQKLIAMREQIIKTATAQGMNRTEVQKFIDTVLKVPTHVPPTKADADTRAARTKMATLKSEIIDTMRDRQAFMYINVSSNVRSAVASVQSAVAAIGASVAHRRDGGPIPGYAGGGKLRGPGTGTSDSIVAVVRQTGRPVMVSAGEYVSTEASTKRNEGALAAGNKGATLGVVGEGVATAELGEATLEKLAAMVAAQMPQGMQGMRIVGTLDTPFGPSEVRGIVKSELSDQALEVSRGVRR